MKFSLHGEAGMPKLAHFGNHFLTITTHFDMSIKPKLLQTVLLFCRVTLNVAFLLKNGTTNQNWQKQHFKDTL